MSYAVYGKRNAWVDTVTHKSHEADARFAALNEKGERVSRLSDALIFYSKEDAKEWIDSHSWRPEANIEIRKVKD